MDSLELSVFDGGLPPSLSPVLPPNRPLVQLALRVLSFEFGLLVTAAGLMLVVGRAGRRYQLTAGRVA